MIVNGGPLGARPHEELLSFGDVLGERPHEALLQFDGVVSGDLEITAPFEGYFPHDELIHYADGALGFSFPNPVKAVKDVGKGAVNAVKDAGKAVGDVGEAIGKGFIKAGKFTVKIGGKVVDVALLPFNVFLKLSMKIADTLCNKMPPAVFVAAATAGSAAAGKPMNPAQSAKFRQAFCGATAALKAGKINNVKDIANIKKMLPVAMKIGTEGMKLAQQDNLRALQSGMKRKMQEQGVPPAAQAAAEQMVAAEEIDALFTEGSKQLEKNARSGMRSAFKEGEKIAKRFATRQGRNALSNLTAKMSGMAAAAQAAAEIPGFEAQVNASASFRPKTQAQTSRRAGRGGGARRRRGTPIRAARLTAAKAAIRRLESMGRKKAANRMRAKLRQELSGLSGPMTDLSPTAKGLIAGAPAGAALVTGIVLAARR